MSFPTVSVVMSVFNGEEFLSETIDSVLNQSFRDFEFVIVDDGSTDATADILSKYALRDGRIRVLRNGKKGRAASLNLGITLANGKYVANTDADDLAMPERLEEQVAFMERNPEVGALGGAFELITDSGEVIDIIRRPFEDSEIRSVILRYNPICHSSVLLRKDIVLALGGYRSIFVPSEDYDLWLRMSEQSRLANLNNVLVQYRIHANQLTVRKLEHQTLCMLAASAAAKQRRNGRPDPLSGADEITRQLLDTLGVTVAEIQEALLDTYGAWAKILKPTAPEVALRVIEGLLQLPCAESFDRSVLANSWLDAAGIHYRQGRPGKALAAAGRAVLVRPIVAGRPVKRAFTRLTAALKG